MCSTVYFFDENNLKRLFELWNYKMSEEEAEEEKQHRQILFDALQHLASTVYKTNPYIRQRLDMYLANLPTLLETEHKKQNERIEMSLEQEQFHKVFLNKHPYYFMPYNNLYYEYNGDTYKDIREDDIYYHLLKSITNNDKLVPWKHKLKQTVMKSIKNRSLFTSTPNTSTIQRILEFLQSVFPSKAAAKYFLTVVGDCLLKKNNDQVQRLYFVSSDLKPLLTFIDQVACRITGNGILTNFITKYHDSHVLSLYRLVKSIESTRLLSPDLMKTMIHTRGTDLLCVAAHYSERYTSADHYLEKDADADIASKVLFFAQHSVDDVIGDFLAHYIEHVTDDSEISWKNMHFLWKLYLQNANLPNMMYSQKLQECLMSKLPHCHQEMFFGVTSKYLPNVRSFLTFWDNHIVIGTAAGKGGEYEIDELMTLYKTTIGAKMITEKQMTSIIGHYFSQQVEIVDEKYVTNIQCSLWNKEADLEAFVEFTQQQQPQKASVLISMDELYQAYKSYLTAKSRVDQKSYMIVAKQFFENYIRTHLAECIQLDDFVCL